MASSRTRTSLQHLQRLKPLDGYSIENYIISTSGKQLWRLKRRGVPLCDDGFLEIVVLKQNATPLTSSACSGSGSGSGSGSIEGCVVGIQDMTSNNEAGRGIVLVNKDGSVANNNGKKGRVVTVLMKDTLNDDNDGMDLDNNNLRSSGNNRNDDNHDNFFRSGTNATGNSTSRARSATAASTAAGAGAGAIDLPNLLSNITLSNICNNDQLPHYILLLFVGLVALKLILAILGAVLFNGGGLLGMVLLPVLYHYALQYCPRNESFDAKRELKRVMRGAHLPEEHQPKGFLEQSLNRLAASISTELATSLGYEVEITDYFGAAKMAYVRVPVAGTDFYWIGIFGKWRFLGQREVPRNRND